MCGWREGRGGDDLPQGHLAAAVLRKYDGLPALWRTDDRPRPRHAASLPTDPEIAWVGLTEPEARARGLDITVGRFPLRALGRARTLGRTDGLAKIIAAADTGLVLGVGMHLPRGGR